MYITASAMVMLQLLSKVEAAKRYCSVDSFQKNDRRIQKKSLCPGSGRRGGGPITFTCGNQGTTLTVNQGGDLIFKAPNVDSQIMVQCGGVGNEYWLFCPAGLTDGWNWPECKNQVQVWSALKKG